MPSQNRMPVEPLARMRSVRRSIGISNEAHYGNLYGENAALTPGTARKVKLGHNTRSASIEIRHSSEDNLPTYR
jgi:hypothetical protein